MREPEWVGKETAMAVHDRQLAEHGGLAGVRDEGLLESALAKPQNLFYYSGEPVDAAAMAASYAYGIATNHPFLDGNKRTALVVSFLFLGKNGKWMTSSEEENYLTIYRLAAGELTEAELAMWFRANTKDV